MNIILAAAAAAAGVYATNRFEQMRNTKGRSGTRAQNNRQQIEQHPTQHSEKDGDGTHQSSASINPRQSNSSRGPLLKANQTHNTITLIVYYFIAVILILLLSVLLCCLSILKPVGIESSALFVCMCAGVLFVCLCTLYRTLYTKNSMSFARN